MCTSLFNALVVIMGFVFVVIVSYCIPQFFWHKRKRKQFLDKYGKFIGKKGFFDKKTNQFLDENKKPVLDLPGFDFVFRITGLIPCILQEDANNPCTLTVSLQKFTVDFEVKYVGEITVLYHPEYGEISYPTEKLKTRPTIGSSIRLCGNPENRQFYWLFSWQED